MGRRPVPTAPKLANQLQFNPHIFWDPVPPWVSTTLDPRVIKELTTVRLEHQRDVLALQTKALDKALDVIKRG